MSEFLNFMVVEAESDKEKEILAKPPKVFTMKGKQHTNFLYKVQFAEKVECQYNPLILTIMDTPGLKTGTAYTCKKEALQSREWQGKIYWSIKGTVEEEKAPEPEPPPADADTPTNPVAAAVQKGSKMQELEDNLLKALAAYIDARAIPF